MSLISLFVAGFITQNIILYYFLGICPFVGVSDKEKNALGMGISVLVVTVLSSIIGYSLYNYILLPAKSTYLTVIIFILVIASLVQMTDIIIKRFFPKLHKSFGIYLPLITTNCAVLGIVLLSVNSNFTFVEMLVYALASSLGFTFVIYIFATLRERMDKAPIPKSFKGYPIALITAGIMALIFSRFVF